jgi:hypothetical protein
MTTKDWDIVGPASPVSVVIFVGSSSMFLSDVMFLILLVVPILPSVPACVCSYLIFVVLCVEMHRQ